MASHGCAYSWLADVSTSGPGQHDPSSQDFQENSWAVSGKRGLAIRIRGFLANWALGAWQEQNNLLVPSPLAWGQQPGGT